MQLFASIRIFATFDALLAVANLRPRDAEKVITVDPTAGSWSELPLVQALLSLIGKGFGG